MTFKEGVEGRQYGHSVDFGGQHGEEQECARDGAVLLRAAGGMGTREHPHCGDNQRHP